MADDNKEIRRKLGKLLQMDVDAVAVYEEVLQHVEDEDVRKNFQLFKKDHEWHAESLLRMISDLGGDAARPEPDLAGRFAEWVSGLRARMSDEGPVKAMHTAEEYHVDRYGEAAGWTLPEEISAAMHSFLADERRHLAYTEQQLGATTGR